MMSSEAVPDSFVVTITTQDRAFSIDMSLPSWMSADELGPQIAASIKPLDDSIAKWEACAMFIDGHQIRGKQTLASAGAFDGSVIVVTRSNS